ncbi:MAG: S8 family serine peptidase [Candidatus Bipolaricaulia bacterium]
MDLRKPITFALLCAFLLAAVAMCAGAERSLARLHPTLRTLFVATTDAVVPQSEAFDLLIDSGRFQLTLSPTSVARIGVLAKLRDATIGSLYRRIPVLGEAGTIYALAVTIAELAELASDPNVIYIEPSWKTRPALDRSLIAINADAAHDASPAILGDEAVVGLVDTGIDYTHLDFRVDTDGDGVEESSRIHSIWDQTWGLLGAEYSRSEIEDDLALGLGPDAGLVRTRDGDGHGTHVAGIAAGDGTSSVSGFVGVAPEATIVAVKTSFFTADIISGVQYVFAEAASLGLPAVVNLSLGGHEGPHDGTSLFEEGLDQLASGPGRVIVVSAGNEGNLPIHTASTLQGGSVSFIVEPEEWEIEIQLWYPGASRFTITLFPPADAAIRVPSGSDTGYVFTANGTALVDNASAGVNPNNGDHLAFIRLVDVGVGDRWRIEVSDEGGGGRFDAWITSQTGIIEGGDSSSTIDEPGNGNRVITVGAFNSKSTWPSLSGNQDFSSEYPVGELSAFSSRGPTRDGRTKPEISAPGAWVCSAASSSAASFGYLTHPDGVHVVEIGTSMAAPHVTGAVALLLSLDSTLSAEEVRGTLTSTASSDAITGFVPNALWGWGRLDVGAAIDDVESGEPPVPPVDPNAPEIGLANNPVASSARFTYESPQGTTAATLRVYTVAGALVFETSVSPTAGTYDWDLRTNRGETLAIGLYLYVLITDRGASRVGRLVIDR